MASSGKPGMKEEILFSCTGSCGIESDDPLLRVDDPHFAMLYHLK